MFGLAEAAAGAAGECELAGRATSTASAATPSRTTASVAIFCGRRILPHRNRHARRSSGARASYSAPGRGKLEPTTRSQARSGRTAWSPRSSRAEPVTG